MPDDLSAELPLLQLFDALPDGITYVEAVRNEQRELKDFRVAYMNAPAIAMAGDAYPTGSGAQFLRHSQPDGLFTDMLFQQYAEVLTSGQALSFSYWYPAGNRHITAQCQKFNDGVLSVMRDSTEQYRADQQRLADLLDASFDGIAVYQIIENPADPAVRFAYSEVNRAYRQMAGLVGDEALPPFPGPMETELLPILHQVAHTGQPQQTVVQNWTNPLNIWYKVVVIKRDQELVGTFQDITNNWQCELLNTVLEHTPSGICAAEAIRDETGGILDFQGIVVNDAALVQLGLEREAVAQSTARQLDPAFETSGRLATFQRVLETGEVYRMQYLHTATNRWMELIVSRMDEETLIAVFTDVTAIRQVQQKLELSVSDLQQSNANLEQFAYVASHDLQEPLRKIVSFGNILADQYAAGLGADGVDIIGRMRSAASRMQSLVRDVLAYSRLTANEDAFQLIDMNQLIQGVLVDLETAIVDRQAVIEVAPMGELRGDALQLRQLFQNLISNALKFVRAGVQPHITISYRRISALEAPVPISAIDQQLVFDLIEVTDNGIGFEQSQASRIFQVFQRLHGRSAYAGTGIGLAIVQRVIENHRGYIAAEGRPGEGATFRICFPVHKNR
ncbi:PAS domain-containing protein [Spirosoma taeanense]|uniref:histidine kinase n=1 Tax=Spirosoma taeanense TaxID=2735870 RepID=A0A6M5Y734_9BACT|nr:ATP-binding protein [Spirosoma taeanense]QJW88883.1 PAS domain-containing protein [Spirosoma taeanense]